MVLNRFNSIQFKNFIPRCWPSKFTTYLPWDHPNMWTTQQFVHTYIQNNRVPSDKHRQTQLTISYKNISI